MYCLISSGARYMLRMLHFVIEGTRGRVHGRNSVESHQRAALRRIKVVFEIKKLLSAAIAFPALLAAAGLLARALAAKLELGGGLGGELLGVKSFEPFGFLFLLSLRL